MIKKIDIKGNPLRPNTLMCHIPVLILDYVQTTTTTQHDDTLPKERKKKSSFAPENNIQ